MAKHRVKENGHIVWLTDEEYKEREKKGCLQILIGIAIVIGLILYAAYFMN